MLSGELGFFTNIRRVANHLNPDYNQGQLQRLKNHEQQYQGYFAGGGGIGGPPKSENSQILVGAFPPKMKYDNHY